MLFNYRVCYVPLTLSLSLRGRDVCQSLYVYVYVCVCVCVCVVAVPNTVNEDRLCHDHSLQRDEWPWIGKTRQSSPSFTLSKSAGVTAQLKHSWSNSEIKQK